MQKQDRTPTVHMGLPSTESDFIEFTLDLNHYLIKNPTSTFFMQLEGDTLNKHGFHKKDILVIDRSKINFKKPQVFELEGQFKVLPPFTTPPLDAIFWGSVIGLARKI